MVQAKRRSGVNPRSYMGVEALQVPFLKVSNSPPTSDITKNFNIGAVWLVTNEDLLDPVQVWELTSQTSITGNWVQIYPSGDAGATDFITNSGTATQSGGTLNILGGTNVNTSGTGNTVTANLDTNVTISGTVDVTTLEEAVIETDSNGLLVDPDTFDGDVLIGATGSQPLWQQLTSDDNSVEITNGSNTINIDVAFGPENYRTDDGIASTLGGDLNYFGDGNTTTTAALNDITVDLASDVTIAGWTTENNTTIGNDLTTNGSNVFTGVGSGIMQTNSSGDVFADTGTDGQLLIGATGMDTTWGDLTSTGGTISIARGANSLNIERAGGGGGGDRLSFLYTQNSNVNFVRIYFLGSSVMLTKRFDDGDHMNPGNGAGTGAFYTVPSTGRWYLNMLVTAQIPVTPYYAYFDITGVIIAGSRSFTNTMRYYNRSITQAMQQTCPIDVCTDLSTGDTVKYSIKIVTSTGSPTFIVGNASNIYTWVSGYKVK